VFFVLFHRLDSLAGFYTVLHPEPRVGICTPCLFLSGSRCRRPRIDLSIHNPKGFL
jgi:hypothetical protein